MLFSSVSAVVCAWAMSAAAASNPCTNGSFEELTPQGFPADWIPVGTQDTPEDLARVRKVLGRSPD